MILPFDNKMDIFLGEDHFYFHLSVARSIPNILSLVPRFDMQQPFGYAFRCMILQCAACPCRSQMMAHIPETLVCSRRGHNIVVHVASTDSQDMEDLEAEMEEELDSAYEEGVNVDVVPGANLTRNSGRRLKRQEEAATGGRRKREEDAFDQRILQAHSFTKH